MLNKETLKNSIKETFEATFPDALEQAFLSVLPEKSDSGDKIAKIFSKTVCDLVCDKWAEGLANAIDYYVKNAQIFGTIITVGSPTTQTASINSTPMPSTNGAIPNTLGIK